MQLSADENEKDVQESYINANYVTFPTKSDPFMFICAQGPTEATINDMWLVRLVATIFYEKLILFRTMVWDQGIECVLMLTTLVEGGRKKCEQYWPAEANQTLKTLDFEIRTSTVDVDDPYDEAIRKSVIQLRRLDGNDTRTITHVQYVAWPDHGVPSPQAFKKLLDMYNAIHSKAKDPSVFTLVHCSAGVGRTGVFVMVNIILEKVSRMLNAVRSI